MEFSELLEQRRSCRGFAENPVTEEQLDQLVAAGQWAPSPLNLQPFQFIAVTDGGLKQGIRKAGEAARQKVLDNNGPDWVSNYPMDFITECPLILVVLSNPKFGGLGTYFNQPDGALQAASACIQNILLRAEDLGLASLWFTFFAPDDLKPLLAIPDKLDVAGAVLVGTAKTRTQPPPRKSPRLHREKYGE